jgi:hypothetical protein
MFGREVGLYPSARVFELFAWPKERECGGDCDKCRHCEDEVGEELPLQTVRNASLGRAWRCSRNYHVATEDYESCKQPQTPACLGNVLRDVPPHRSCSQSPTYCMAVLMRVGLWCTESGARRRLCVRGAACAVEVIMAVYNRGMFRASAGWGVQ